MRDPSSPKKRRRRAQHEGAAAASCVYDPKTRVWMRADFAGIAYSDGAAVEERLLRLLQSSHDLSTLSDEISSGIVDWPSEAHLSAVRGNLLRPFRFDARQRILEVGAGCGAITRFLGETGARVDALEGARARAACAAERCRDLENVRVFCDEFTGFAADAPYDVVTLIGVLEYSRMFVAGADPVAECLARARSMLADRGVLVLAIENQLGLKYFNGCQEDHLGAPFPGITDLYGAGTPVTFGRRELEARLRAAGFEGVEWYYPFPDYKLPSIVVTQRAFDAHGFSVSDLVFGEFARDYSGNVRRCFDDANVWPVLERNELLPEMANSFLVVASKARDGNVLDRDRKSLAFKYSTFRRRPYATTTTFASERDGGITVAKSLLDPAAAASEPRPGGGLPLVHTVGAEAYVAGNLFAREFSKAVGRGHGLPQLAALLTPWVKLLLESAAPPAGTTQAAAWSALHVPGAFLDFVPFNLIIDGDGRLQPIDSEFAADATIPLPWVVLRGLVHTATRCFGHRALRNLTGEDLVASMLPLLGLSDIADWSPYLALEDELVKAVLRPWPGRKDRDIFRERLALAVATGASYLETREQDFAALAAVTDAFKALLASVRRLGESDGVAGTGASSDGSDRRVAAEAIDRILRLLDQLPARMLDAGEREALQAALVTLVESMEVQRAVLAERAILGEQIERNFAERLAEAGSRLAERDAELAAAQLRHADATTRLEAMFNARLEEKALLLAAKAGELVEARDRHAQALARADAQHMEQLAQLRLQLEGRGRDLDLARGQHAEEIARIEAGVSERLAAARRELEARDGELAQARDHHAEEKARIEADLVERTDSARRQLEERDARWRAIRAETDARFAQREGALAAALVEAQTRLRDREQAFREDLATRDAEANELERRLREGLAAQEAESRMRERQLRDDWAAREAAALHRERLLREDIAGRDTVARQREQELQALVADSEQRAQAREASLQVDIAKLQASLAETQTETRELVALLAVANSNIAVESERLLRSEKENVQLREQLREGSENVQLLEQLLHDQEERGDRAKARIDRVEGQRLFRMIRPFLGNLPELGDGGEARPASKRGNALFQMLRGAYRRLPVSGAAKARAKDFFYGRFGRFFRNVQNYQLWHTQRATIAAALAQANAAQQERARAERTLLPAHDRNGLPPAISVVIPVFGKVEMTRRCIEALRQAGSPVPIEIIVVDDGSPDPISPGLADFSDVTVVRNDANLGFIGACNRGAALAKERYLLFLNNDTEMRPGALGEMLQSFAEHPEAGVVGCKLVFPDGRLQEAGAYVRPDGSAEMVGLWDDPNRGCYAYEREVGYTSGACLMIERELFAALGGFDATFAPAYCEDSDLCFRVRRAGRKIIYQPRATVVHQLSASMQDSPIDKQAVVLSNQAKFLDRWGTTLAADDLVRAIAFYLPQYHSIPENDRWWGRGFTDWTNVAKSRPVFPGHRQPNIPADLGFYDLRQASVREEQANLARRYGIHGFCYYYYWFGGTRLLHEPLDQVLELKQPEFPFCVCWANENWTRRWDGLDSDVLIAQKHSAEDDLQFIASLLPAFRDERYIRVNGRPLLLVYRPSLLPDSRATVGRWRQYCREHGVAEPYLVMTQSFYHLNSTGPHTFGFDAAVEFPPHSLAIEVPSQPRGIAGQRFDGRVYDYPATAANFLRREMPPYKLFRSVMPRWDNTPRRGSSGNVFLNSTPEAFGNWLGRAVDYTKRFSFGDERIVFINAWNEWAEGNYLEPDLQYGHAYLEMVRSVLVNVRTR